MSHISYEALAERIKLAKQSVVVGGTYAHYKSPDKTYAVLSVGLQEDSEQPCVVYQTSHPSGLIWVRNLDDWLAMVENDEGKLVPRFNLIHKV